WVDAGPAEVLFAVKSMAPEQRTTAIEAVERMCGKTGGQGFDARTAMVTPCPLLQGNLCSVYESRPVVCRAAASADAEACRRAYLELGGGNIPVPTAWRALGQAYAAALEGAALHAGLVPTAREWNESLRIALTDARAEVRWLSGEDVFRGASQASATGTFSAPAWGEIYKEAFGSPPPS
ncbi:MAG TPA: hypothetical protein VFU80_08110, partial [Sphingomicrobium sp.]|nr:hypothetical protein [Sphingomicrobium sp.]